MDDYTLLIDYWYLGMSDNQIARQEGRTRTSVSWFRRSRNIPTRITAGRIGELKALQLLNRLGFETYDMNLLDKTYSFDILLNDEIRIDVKSARLLRENKYIFNLSNKIEDGCNHAVYGSRTKKDYTKSCDFLLLVCIEDDEYFLIPSEEVTEKISITIGRYKTKKEKYKIKSRHDVTAAITKLDTSIVADSSGERKDYKVDKEKLIFENERKIINLIRGAVRSRGLSATYSISNVDEMRIHIGYTAGAESYLIDLEDINQIEHFQIELQKKIEAEDEK